MEKTLQFHPGWLCVLGMQAVSAVARLEHVPLAFSLSLLLSPSHSMQQTPPGAPTFGRSLISEHSPLICSLQPGHAARSAGWGSAAAGSSSHLLLGCGSSLDPPPSPVQLHSQARGIPAALGG